MKLNIRPVPIEDLALQEIIAVAYETAHEGHIDGIIQTLHDFNITLYKNNKLLSWIQLCPDGVPGQVEFRNRYIGNDDCCGEVSEKLLHYAEKWAVDNDCQKIVIRACEVSVPYYLRMQYLPQGEPVYENGNLLYNMVKIL